MRRFTKAELAEFARLWALDYTFALIAARLGRSPGSVNQQRQYRWRTGDARFAPRCPRGQPEDLKRRRTDAAVAAAFSRVRGRATVKDLTTAAGISDNAVRRSLRRLGLVLEAPAQPPRLEERVSGMAQAGMTTKAIAAALGCSAKSVREISSRARKMGFTVPYERERPALREMWAA